MVCAADKQKADTLNTFFSSCFNLSHPPLEEKDGPKTLQSNTELDEIFCSIDEVKQLLSNLKVNKASGPDDVSSFMLKCVATSIAPSITQLFNQSIKTGKIPTQ